MGHEDHSGYADVLERLFVEYERKHTLTVIAETTRQCREDLEGQVDASALPQKLDQLARHRLNELTATQPDS